MNDILVLLPLVSTSVFALLAILNPFGNLPVFISMSDDLDEPTRKKLFRSIVFTAAVIMFIFALIGQFVMENIFSLNIAELHIAGGLLFLIMGAKNLLFPQVASDDHKNVINYDEEVSKRIVPMAFPILVGPGTLSTLIIIHSEHGMPITLVSIVVVILITFLLFMSIKQIERVFGKLVLYVISRIMQVFIMAIGAKMFVIGMKSVFPLLAQ
ncbi:MAG: MarC family protein [Deferribacteraceae bacterium]|nr:MarC family protein [Deferribacteraceae bacterium]